MHLETDPKQKAKMTIFLDGGAGALCPCGKDPKVSFAMCCGSRPARDALRRAYAALEAGAKANALAEAGGPKPGKPQPVANAWASGRLNMRTGGDAHAPLGASADEAGIDSEEEDDDDEDDDEEDTAGTDGVDGAGASAAAAAAGAARGRAEFQQPSPQPSGPAAGMVAASSPAQAQRLASENAALRARVGQLEGRLVDLEASFGRRFAEQQAGFARTLDQMSSLMSQMAATMRPQQ